MRLNASPSLSENMSSQQAGSSHLALISNSSKNSSSLSDLLLSRELAFRVAPTLFSSFRYAWEGVCYTFATQRNFRIHTVIGAIALSLSILLQVSAVKMAVIGIMIALVLALELLNTAVESVVDLTVKQSYHDLAKVAKDCAAGAVLMSAIAAVFVAGVILFPPLFAFMMNLS